VADPLSKKLAPLKTTVSLPALTVGTAFTVMGMVLEVVVVAE